VPLPSNGAPLGLQITAAWGRDDALVAVAVEAERHLFSSPTAGPIAATVDL